MITLSIIASILLGIIIFFKIPYSRTKAEYNKAEKTLLKNADSLGGVFTEDDIKDLPEPVKRYFKYCGYLNTPKMSYMRAKFKNVDFVLSPDKPKLKIDYTQFNYVKKPARLAYIDTSLYGIPFQGFDSYTKGIGSMKGVLGKVFTLFNQKGPDMDKGSLVTFLSEALFVPSVALQDYITWEKIDDTHAKATLSFYGISVNGIFAFNEKGEMLSFTTNDRINVSTDGTKKEAPWSALCSNYKAANGIKHPTSLQAVWHYKSGDLVYFDSDNLQIEYGH